MGCFPLYVLAEKRFCVGGKIVETYLDHVDNPRVSSLLQWDLDAKQDLAARFSRLPEDIIVTFATGYRTGDSTLLRDALHRIAICLRLQMEFDLSDAIMGCYENMDEIAEQIRKVGEDVPGGAMASLNLPVFVSFATCADNLATADGATRGVVVHDETKEYEATFRWVFEAFRDAKPGAFRFLGGQEFQFGYQGLKEFRTASSTGEPLIQAADRLAGVIRLYATQALRQESIAPVVAGMATRVLLPSMFSGLDAVSMIGTPSFDDRFFEPIRKAIHDLSETAA